MRWWMMLALAVGCKGGKDVAVDDTEVTDDTVDTETVVDDSDTIVDTDTTGETDETAETDDTLPPLPDDPCITTRPVLRVGTGEFSFESLSAGQNLEMIYGAQGGWHFWGTLAAEHVPAVVIVEFQVVDVETDMAVHTSVTNVALRPIGGGPWACSGTYAGILGVLGVTDLTQDPTSVPPEVLCGREVELRMKLRMASAEREEIASSSTRIIAQPDAAHGAFCTSPTPLP